MAQRNDPTVLWIREGDRMVKARPSPLAHRYQNWIAQAVRAGRLDWIPSHDLDPDWNETPSLVLRGDHWMVLKRWVVGSPEVERAIRRGLTGPFIFRFGILHIENEKRRDLVPQPWGAEPHFQIDEARIVGHSLASRVSDPDFPGYILTALPFAAQRDVLLRQQTRVKFTAYALTSLVALSLLGGFYLRWRARQKALLDANRMASLTHSLKTPLAILKFRCDSIRLGRLTKDQTDLELIRLGEEVDHLALIIESGLQAMRGVPEIGPQAEVTPNWLADIANDLSPVFESEARTLHLNLATETGQAALPSLRAALLTLLENALYHGAGTVTLETHRVRGHLLIKVMDEGKGLGALELGALGRPFMRLRVLGSEGFVREGHGLGISLLCQVARKEGWGLSFTSDPGRGFTAALEIQTI
jgi:signal transduction histidine kinase